MAEASTDSSTPVEYLLAEVARLQAQNRKLRGRVQWLRESRAEWKRRATARLQPSMARDDPRHGTENGYGNLRCRCELCRAAHAEAQRERDHRSGRHVSWAEYIASVEGCHVPHGTESRYVKGKCRCDECKRAASRARNRRRYETPEKIERQRAYDRERKRLARERKTAARLT